MRLSGNPPHFFYGYAPLSSGEVAIMNLNLLKERKSTWSKWRFPFCSSVILSTVLSFSPSISFFQHSLFLICLQPYIAAQCTSADWGNTTSAPLNDHSVVPPERIRHPQRLSALHPCFQLNPDIQHVTQDTAGWYFLPIIRHSFPWQQAIMWRRAIVSGPHNLLNF